MLILKSIGKLLNVLLDYFGVTIKYFKKICVNLRNLWQKTFWAKRKISLCALCLCGEFSFERSEKTYKFSFNRHHRVI